MALIVAVIATAAQASPLTITSCGNVYGDVVLGADLTTTTGDCLRVMANGVTIDGAGHRINATGFAVAWVDHSQVVVRNIVSRSGVQIFGAHANSNRIENSHVGPVGIYMGDDNVVTGSSLTALKVQGLYNEPPLRSVITRNVIEGPGPVLVYLSPGGDGQALCARSDSLIEGNFIHDTAPVSTDNDHVLLYLRCGTHNTIAGNFMLSLGKARGVYMRDDADDNLIQDNFVAVHQGDRAALHFSSGNTDKHGPRNNSFDHNSFYADSTRSLWIECGDFMSNSFTRNVFWSNSPTEGSRITGGAYNVFDHDTFFNGPSGTPILVFQSVTAPGNTYTNDILAASGSNFFSFSGVFDRNGYHADHNVFHWLGAEQSGAVALAGWQQRTGQDAHSIVADPRFVDAPHGKVQLQTTSPALTAASDGGADGAYPPSP